VRCYIITSGEKSSRKGRAQQISHILSVKRREKERKERGVVRTLRYISAIQREEKKERLDWGGGKTEKPFSPLYSSFFIRKGEGKREERESSRSERGEEKKTNEGGGKEKQDGGPSTLLTAFQPAQQRKKGRKSLPAPRGESGGRKKKRWEKE